MKYVVSTVLGAAILLGSIGFAEAKPDPLKEEFKAAKEEFKEVKKEFKEAKQDFKQAKLDFKTLKTDWKEYRAQSVPIPGTLLLFAGGFVGLVGWRMRAGKDDTQ